MDKKKNAEEAKAFKLGLGKIEEDIQKEEAKAGKVEDYDDDWDLEDQAKYVASFLFQI